MKKLAMGQLESAVMDVVWDRGGWLTPGEVHTELSTRHAVGYTTVMTVLVRLWRKGRLERQRDGRAYAYHPVETRAEHAAGQMGKLLADARDSTAALSHFVRVMTPDERAQLRRLLARRSQS